MKFPLGDIVMTRGVGDRAAHDLRFADLLVTCLRRHAAGDWGNVYEEDRRENDYAVDHGLRILSAYTIDPKKGESKGYGDNTLWIITEADRSVTTLLFPDEY